MSKQDMNRQLTQNQNGAMSDDPKDGSRNSETLGRDGPPTAVEKAPEENPEGVAKTDALRDDEVRERANG